MNWLEQSFGYDMVKVLRESHSQDVLIFPPRHTTFVINKGTVRLFDQEIMVPMSVECSN